MLRSVILGAPVVAALVAVGCGGTDTSNCQPYCAYQEKVCPLTAPSSDSCEGQCEQELDGLYNVSDTCGQAYDAWLVCMRQQGSFDCSATNAPPSGCDSELAAWQGCGIRQ